MSAPLIDPKTCSDRDLIEIIETDPNASAEYHTELKHRERRRAEAEHWENHFGVDE